MFAIKYSLALKFIWSRPEDFSRHSRLEDYNRRFCRKALNGMLTRIRNQQVYILSGRLLV